MCLSLLGLCAAQLHDVTLLAYNMGKTLALEDRNIEDSWSADDSQKSAITMSTEATGVQKSAVASPANTPTVTDENLRLERLLMGCSRCHERYSEANAPRLLSCGHTLCTSCVKVILGWRKICPECQEKQLVNSVSDFHINYPVMGLIRSIRAKEVSVSDVIIPVHPYISASDSHEHAGPCPIHGSPMMFMCMSCSTWICHDCLVLKHPSLPRGSCRVLNIKEAMARVREEYENRTKLALGDVEHIQKNLDPEIARHNFSLKHCPHDLRSHIRLISFIEREFEEMRKKDDPTVSLAVEHIEKSSEIVKKTTSPEQITTSCKELVDCQTKLKDYLVKEKERKVPLMRYISSHLTMDLRLLVNRRKNIYAVLEEEGKGPRWALLTCRDDRLLLYSLRDGKPPADGLIIPYDFARNLLPRKDTNIFFEVGTKDDIFGRVYIRLYGDTPRGRQALLLCTGEKGPSYRSSCFYEYDSKDCMLRGGDYENNDGTGGCPVVSGLYDSDGESEYLKIAGAFVSELGDLARFRIHLENLPHEVFYIIGKVKEGLSFLKAASKLEPVTNSVIRDCGVHIPMQTQAFDISRGEEPKESGDSEDSDDE